MNDSAAQSQQQATGEVHLHQLDGVLRIEFIGDWTQSARIKDKPDVSVILQRSVAMQKVRFETDQLHCWDSRLPAYLMPLLKALQTQKINVDTGNLPSGVQALLALAMAVPERGDTGKASQPVGLLSQLGISVISTIANAKLLLTFIGETQIAFWQFFRGRARVRAADFFLCLQAAGPEALPIVTLISLLVGLILAFVGAIQLALFGAQIFIADLVGLGTVREMGALMTAVIMSGRTGAAYAAQLGTMQVNQEIDAIKTMGISATEFLVLPRISALVLMMPLLCLYANVIGILGGALVTVSAFDVSLIQYFNETVKAVHLPDFMIGLFKSAVFALLIATAGCMRGMQCGRSASAVGDATTAAVVDSIVYIVIADSVITLICDQLGI